MHYKHLAEWKEMYRR